MSEQKGGPLTPAERQARPRNVEKCAGPRTPMGKKIASLNAVKHGRRSSPSIQTMAVLRENQQGTWARSSQHLILTAADSPR